MFKIRILVVWGRGCAGFYIYGILWDVTPGFGSFGAVLS